jgi:hypothetical protein
MDRIALEERRCLAKEHVALGRRYVTREMGIVAALERDGHDTVKARDRLEIFRTILELHEAALDRLERSLIEEP